MEIDTLKVEYKKSKILTAGIDYLKVNEGFLKLFNAGKSDTIVSNYNLQKMRPSIRTFTDLIREVVNFVVAKIQNISGNSASIFKQIEFWVLVISLLPYIYFSYRIISIVARLIIWGIFS